MTTAATYMERVTLTRSQLDQVGDLCDGIVTRGGIEDACCKDASTILYDAESAALWPACTWHAHRYGGALTLAQIATLRNHGTVSFEREVSYS